MEVHAADADGLELTAAGPISIDVRYALEPVDGGSEVRASVGVRGGSGLTGRLLASATSALLKGGALDLATGRIARAAEAAPSSVRLAVEDRSHKQRFVPVLGDAGAVAALAKVLFEV